MKIKRITTAAVAFAIALAMTSCGTHYCSYGGCMKKVENKGDRCSTHKGLDNDQNYGVPKKWQTHN
jgi:hypothetical protein